LLCGKKFGAVADPWGLPYPRKRRMDRMLVGIKDLRFLNQNNQVPFELFLLGLLV
jgi:hypothetical protein